MLCSSKTSFFFIILSISISKGISYSDDDSTSGYLEDNAIDSEYFTTSDAFFRGATERKGHIPDIDEIESSQKTFMDSINQRIEYRLLKEKCTFYKHGKELDVDKVADVWQVVYFQLKEDVPCFKIYIKRTTDEEKRAYSELYGSFSDKVNWTACDLEIRASDKSDTERRHFLQRGNKGIMDNVIILERNDRENVSYSLHAEHPDHWLVVKNLLLMRDCHDGEVVVFSRFPHQPRRKDIRDALATFGEYIMEGKLPCK